MKFLIILIAIVCFAEYSYGSENNTLECVRKEKPVSHLEIAVEMITKVRDNFPAGNSSLECVQRDKSMSQLEVAIEIIKNVKDHFPTSQTNKSLIYPSDCEDLILLGHNKSGVYEIWPKNRLLEEKSINVYCDMETDGGGWTVIQRRGDFGLPNDYFYREWSNYKNGFGIIDKEFWLGNDNIFYLTNQKPYAVRFDLTDSEGEKIYALYDKFWIDDESYNYTIHIKGYSGDAGDSMNYHDNQQFSTNDNDNDKSSDNCAKTYKSGWWFNSCHYANLNGIKLKGINGLGEGINWYLLKTNYESLEFTEIKIRSSSYKSHYRSLKVEQKF